MTSLKHQEAFEALGMGPDYRSQYGQRRKCIDLANHGILHSPKGQPSGCGPELAAALHH